jgi:flagellar biosynthesis protein FlhB
MKCGARYLTISSVNMEGDSAKSAKFNNAIALIYSCVISWSASGSSVIFNYAQVFRSDVKKASALSNIRSVFEQIFNHDLSARLVLLVDLALAIHLRCTCPHRNEVWLLCSDVLIVHFQSCGRDKLYRVRTI